MLLYLLYTPFLLLLLSNLIALRVDSDEKSLTLSMVQTIVGIPLLAGLYLYLGFSLKPEFVPLLLFSENVFALNWFYLAHRFEKAIKESDQISLLARPLSIIIGTSIIGLSLCFTFYPPQASLDSDILILKSYGPIYICAIFFLLSALAAAWHLERFWRALSPSRRWVYKVFVIGSFLICGAIGWAASFRMTFMYLATRHIALLAGLLFLAWICICYSVARHKLLNRKIFVSRKIVYSFISPVIFAAYFLALGTISLTIRYLGLPLHFAIFWLLVIATGIAIGIYVTSGNLRKQMHYFISTHFYINKYEYRDEWLDLSRELQGAFSETEVLAALSKVLAKSLYTESIAIWLGDSERGYKVVSQHGSLPEELDHMWLDVDDPLILFCHRHAYFYFEENPSGSEWQEVADRKKELFSDLNLVLFTPLLAGDKFMGLIGLGPEYTGGRYGHDDFDLLTAIGTQAASALLSVRMAEELSLARESQAWDKLSSFVLHDIKNASNMLSLVKTNAEHHINNPQFQRDLLETIDGALRRMKKVQTRLSALEREVRPNWQNIDLKPFLNDVCKKYSKQLRPMKITLDCPNGLQIYSDRELLNRVLENLLLNALEAGGDSITLQIRVSEDEKNNKRFLIEVTDSGPGIPSELLPNNLFKRYRTTKPEGNGIGLWQVHMLVNSLGGTISAENPAEGGARFVLRLPAEKAE